MLKVIRDIFRHTIREKLPKLENTLTVQFRPEEVDAETYLVLLAGVAKDPETAKRLMEEYNVTTGPDLLAVLPKRQIHWRRRLRLWIQGLEGSLTNDPYELLLWPSGDGSNYLKEHPE